MPDTTTIPLQISKAIEDDDPTSVAALVRDNPQLVWTAKRPGWTHWMMVAADLGRVSILKVLVDAGADINAPKAAGSTAPPEGVVDMAASQGQLEATRWLLDHGAKLNHEVGGQMRCFALSGAAGAGHLEVVRLLVEREALVNASWGGMTALDHAETYGQNDVASYLRSVGGKRADELG